MARRLGFLSPCWSWIKYQKNYGGGAVGINCRAGIYLFSANQHAINYVNWLLSDYVCVYVRLLRLGSLCSEIWPTEAKLRGSGLANAVGRISGIAAPYAVAVLLNGYGVTGVFVLLGTVSIIVAIAIATIGIETKGVSVESLGIDAVTSK